MTYIGTQQQAFSHADGAPPPAGTPMSSTTRYLSGAAYVDQRYAQLVIDEMIGQSHRAVAPALGYDVVTIVRHCLRAQRLWLAQNAILTTVLLAGVFFFTGVTVTTYAICLLAYFFLPGARSDRRTIHGRPTWQVVLVAVGVLFLAGCLFGPAKFLLDAAGGGSFGSGSFGSGSFGSSLEQGYGNDSGDDLVRFLLGVAAVVLVQVAVLTVYRYRTIEIITTDLARGQGAGTRRSEAREIEQRLGVIGAAQGGNIVLHAGFEPFVGAGERVNAWSIATELRPEEPAGRHGPGAPARVDIDPVDLMRHVRQRLAALRARDLPEPSRITGLQLRDQVISSGTRWHDYPLIDEAARLPFSFAEQATVDAIVRAPQTSARHFLRATVGAPDRAAVGADGRTIMPAEHQSVISSTFIHVAVEGGLLYVELVATVLGPIRQAYLNIDRYAATEDKLSPAVGEAFRRFLGDVAVAPVRLVQGVRRRVTLIGAIHRADREAASEPVYDFGSRLDVRQLASRSTYANYLQRLDAEKYTRLIDRRTTEAIHEYLVAHGVDDSDFVAKVNHYEYNNVAVAGDNYGPLANGSGATANQSGPARGSVK